MYTDRKVPDLISRDNLDEKAENLAVEAISSITPDINDLKGSSYSEAEIKLDTDAYDLFTKSPSYVMREKESSSYQMERNFIALYINEDWPEEELTRYETPRKKTFRPTDLIPTTDIDDAFNHVDMVGIIQNEASNYRRIPFGIDVTYNSDTEDLRKKFGHIHQYGLVKRIRDEEKSEFGYIESVTEHGETRQEIYPHATKYRFGLKIPGFSSVKFFENTVNPEAEDRKGRIGILPRLVIGCDKEIVDTINLGVPQKPEEPGMSKDLEEDNDFAREDMEKYRTSMAEYEQSCADYELACETMKICTMAEMKEQADLLEHFLEKINETRERMTEQQERMYQRAKEEVKTVQEYAGAALNFAEGLAEISSVTRQAFEKASQDKVRVAISEQARKTYIEGDYDSNGTSGDTLYAYIRDTVRKKK